MMLKKKLRNNTTLIRTAILGGLSPLAGMSVLYISMIKDATIEENKLFYRIFVKDHDVNESPDQRCAWPLTSKTIEFVLPIKLWTRFWSLISASVAYSFQYVAEVSPYLGAMAALITAQRS